MRTSIDAKPHAAAKEARAPAASLAAADAQALGDVEMQRRHQQEGQEEEPALLLLGASLGVYWEAA